jgi:hypothetical protein
MALFVASGILAGCLGSGGSLTNLPTDEKALVKLKIRLGRVDSRSDVDPAILSKGSSIEIQNLVVTFTSNLGDTVRDTVSSVEGSLHTSAFLSDSVLVDVSLRALRWWNIDIETHDQYDSVVHKGTAGPFSSKGGQTVDLTIPLLNSRYLMYEARYSLPSEIYSSSLDDSNRVTQKIYFYKLVLEIDGDTVRDSSSFSPAITRLGTRFIYADTSKVKNSAGKFFFKPNGTGADTATHVQAYEYVRVGAHDFKMSALGYLEGDSVGGTNPRLLFQGQSKINVLQGGVPEEKSVKLDWMGPGSEAAAGDTTTGPGSPNWSGVSMTVKLGRVRGTGKATVGIIGEFPEN